MSAEGINCFQLVFVLNLCICSIHRKKILNCILCHSQKKTFLCFLAFSKAFQNLGNYSQSVSLHHRASVTSASAAGGRKYNAVINPLTVTEPVRSQVLLLNPDTALLYKSGSKLYENNLQVHKDLVISADSIFTTLQP